jgi:hypothetical protein
MGRSNRGLTVDSRVANVRVGTSSDAHVGRRGSLLGSDQMDRTIRRAGPSPAGWASGVLLIFVVALLTLAIRAHELSFAPFAASAAKIGAGEIWLLPTSALVVDRPVEVGLIAFGLLAFATLWICGARVFWIAAAAGHIGSTLAVYALIGLSRLANPHVFTSAMVRQDFGVSAIQAAWVGAIASTAWRSSRADPRARVFVGAGIGVVAGVAWWLHPDPSILTTEHLFAFIIGCGLVSWPRLAARARRIRRGPSRPEQSN